ncbi:LysR family transcriptional regulator [Aquicoccus sp. SCR17]|nr:LysR family transcriptional regulator [Carideicomes alvinocaridis]
MSRRPLPPLNSLRAFEAVAREQSLSAASDELGVTASAVGHQIRNLEKNLGIRLFDRRGKRLVPTQTGARYAEALGRGFDTLFRATEAIRRQEDGAPITVSATPAMALRWLAPVLDRFREDGLGEFRIDASSREADLAAGEADLDIRYGRAADGELMTEVLFSESVFPVCDAAHAAALTEAAELTRAPLIFVDDWGRRGGTWSAWRDWCAAAGVPGEDLREAGRYAEMDRAVAAAAAGEGLAIGAQRHLDQHPALVRPFDGPEVTYSAFLVALPEVAEEPTIRRLMKRLVAEARRTRGVIHEGAF